MTPKKHNLWVEKLKKEGLLEEDPVWLVDDPTKGLPVTVQASKQYSPEDTARPAKELRKEPEIVVDSERVTSEVSLDKTMRSRHYPDKALREAMARGEPKVAAPSPPPFVPKTAVAQSDVEANWFAGPRPKPSGTYSHTETRRFISVHGKQISVEPAAPSEPAASIAGAILDVPPTPSSPAATARISQSLASLLPNDDVLFGGGAVDDETAAKKQREAMHECYDLGDYSDALVHAESILKRDRNDREALAIFRDSRTTLERMYETRLGDLGATPHCDVQMDELMWRKLDPTVTFLLSLVDGVLTFENVLDICGFSRFDALRLLVRLKEDGIIH
ncbi:MAG: hypothetical protein MUC50_04910 [Myxococcota bacterium]|jgi:hypothetical protein|nr:hypothetical protein [Myxococcota bacterium]